jgi:hypothetical protein
MGKAKACPPSIVELVFEMVGTLRFPPYETTPASCGVNSYTDEQNVQVTPLCHH